MDEFKTPRNPNNLFGVSKNSLFNLIDSFSKIKSISYAWARIFFTYGPNENSNKLITHVLEKLNRNEIAETTDGNQIRDFMHSEDIALALVKLIESDLQGPINIGSGENISIKNILKIIGEITEKEQLIKIGAKKSRPNDPISILANTERLRNELGFNLRYNIREGLKDLNKFIMDKQK